MSFWSKWRRAVLLGALGLAAGAPCAAQTAAADSAPKPPADSTPLPSADTARRRRPVPTPIPVPLDSALAASCAGAPAGGGPTADLLVVIFMAGTEASERESVAKSAGGILAGPAGPGGTAFYVRVGSEPQAIVADRLIRAIPVRMVTPAACPPRPAAAPPDTAKKPPEPAPQRPS
ncbi:MAG: hypothetical protein ACREMG_13890 [Gemmatimonadales bacterium]